jgi:hypothetical protein
MGYGAGFGSLGLAGLGLVGISATLGTNALSLMIVGVITAVITTVVCFRVVAHARR